jgi:hypothetical protein
MAKASAHPEKDTPKVNRGIILLGFQIQSQRYERGTNGQLVKGSGRVTIRGNVKLFYPQKVIDWFNIPTYTEPENSSTEFKLITVRAHSRSVFKSVDDATAASIDIAEFQRIASPVRGQGSGKSVSVPLGESRVTAKGNPRTIALRFPKFFNNIMIGQALGQMLATATSTKKPGFFTSKAGASYRIPYNNTDGVLSGANCGAWLMTAIMTESNTDNPGDGIGQNTEILSSAGDQDKTGT